MFPQPEVIELIQDKILQKKFYQAHGIPTAPFIITEDKDAVKKNVSFFPAVHKLAQEGYDGRGVRVIRSEKDINKAFDAPGLLEKLIDIDKEISVIIARSLQGEIMAFPPVVLHFHQEYHLVEYLFAPAILSQDINNEVLEIAEEIIEKLEIVGLLAVEMFVTKEEKILVNEIAPRPHNSGHHTIEANITSQFEQHIRAILGFPLGATQLKTPAAMVNLLGEPGHTGLARYEGLKGVLEMEEAHIHLYGKKITKPFRKMGHVTIIDKNMERLESKVKFVKEKLKVIS